MKDARGHHFEVRHEDAPDLLSRQIVLCCVDCKTILGVRVIPAFRQISFRDREALEQWWAVHVTHNLDKLERWPDADLMPY